MKLLSLLASGLAVAVALSAPLTAFSAQQVRKHDAKRAQCQKQAMQERIAPEKSADFMAACMERKALERAGVKKK